MADKMLACPFVEQRRILKMDPSIVKKSPSPEDKGLAHRALIVIGIVVAIVVLLALLWFVVDVLLLAFAGILLAIVLRTPADWLSRHSPLSPGWSVAIVNGIALTQADGLDP
ncbi:MAG: hypothetical protein ACREV3_10745 [Gammaproteobacteria bacterium]